MHHDPMNRPFTCKSYNHNQASGGWSKHPLGSPVAPFCVFFTLRSLYQKPHSRKKGTLYCVPLLLKSYWATWFRPYNEDPGRVVLKDSGLWIRRRESPTPATAKPNIGISRMTTQLPYGPYSCRYFHCISRCSAPTRAGACLMFAPSTTKHRQRGTGAATGGSSLEHPDRAQLRRKNAGLRLRRNQRKVQA